MFYADRFTNEVIGALGKGAVNVAGGRGVGKTTLLQAIVTKDEGRHPHVLLPVRDASRTVEILNMRSQETTDSEQTILVDDADLLIFFEAEREMKRAMELIDLLQKLRQRRNTNLLLASTGKLYDWLNEQPYFLTKKIPFPPEFLLKYSILCTDLQIHILNPWFPGWQKEWLQEFDQREGPRGMNVLARELWSQAILEETGGHPALFGPVVERLEELLQRKELPHPYSNLLRGESLDGERTKRLTQRYIEDWIEEDGARSVKSAIRRLRDSAEPVERRAFAYLVRMASGNPTLQREYDPTVVKILIDTALITHDDENIGEYIIPGIYLQRLLQRIGERAPHTLITTSVSRVMENDYAQLLITNRKGEHRRTLRGGPGELFKVLDDANGQLVPMREISQKTSLKDDRAVQNAVTRLRRKLDGLDFEIISERGHGYRLLKEMQGTTFR